MKRSEHLRQSILAQVAEYYNETFQDREFIPGKSRVHYAGRVFDALELQNAVGAALDFWLTAGPETAKFEKRLGQFLGIREVIPVNSGSSANLVATTALCSKQFRSGLRPGDEVIVPAASFPTTVNPIIQNQLMPVFVDSSLSDYNLDPVQVAEAITPKTKAIIFAHTLGNPADMDEIMTLVREHDLLLIEDACDALGSTWDGKLLGTFGHFATLSFYPAHHMTVGEGGAVFTSSRRLAKIARSVRDWGRDCWCGYDDPPDGRCNQRFERLVPGMPGFYDHRYLYTEIGYNLKLTDLQAAIGLAQLAKLPGFIAKRKQNFGYLYQALQDYSEHLILPSWQEKSDPSWFAFPLTVRDSAPFERYHLTRFLEENNIETRPLFAGNLLMQPGYRDIIYRAVGDLPVSNQILRSTFFVGIYPGLDHPQLDYVVEIIDAFFRKL
ncbi:MAG: lipopolysaccharide biosynthesis protein RfbH [Candidatus Promineifilaceae bacterium]